ncbi:hypothetical protein GQX73_g6549 [Xylaria multiplex]|uniref:Uncharacterized protein n=1 Tax=Xylaria multiplex TaxID=323545 RepID=A0A7C8IM04_9PEZI|nr:hypothetical protein GQX73_g6549 [Xylaria multiplex]
MSLWEAYKRSIALEGEDDLQNPMFNDTAFEAGLRALRSNQGRNSTAPPAEQPVHPRVSSSSPISRADRSPSVQSKALGEEPDARDATRADTSPTSNPRAQDPTTTSADKVSVSGLREEREEIVRQVIEILLPRIEQAAAAAAEREIDKLIEAANGETTREKIQAILSRVDTLPEGDLDNLFLRSDVMATALRTVLRRAELEEAVGEWEDLASGR